MLNTSQSSLTLLCFIYFILFSSKFWYFHSARLLLISTTLPHYKSFLSVQQGNYDCSLWSDGYLSTLTFSHPPQIGSYSTRSLEGVPLANVLYFSAACLLVIKGCRLVTATTQRDAHAHQPRIVFLGKGLIQRTLAFSTISS